MSTRVKVSPGTTRLVLAAVAFLLAAIGSVLGGDRHSTYSWSRGASVAPLSQSDDIVIDDLGQAFQPLLLANHRPSELSVSWGCRETPSEPATVFSTTRQPDWSGNLSIVADADGWALVVDGDRVHHLEAGSGNRCRLDVEEDATWRLLVDDDRAASGTIDDLPVVSGLRSDLSDESDSVVVRITTTRNGLVSSLLRTLARTLGLAALAAYTVSLLRAYRLRPPRPGTWWTGAGSAAIDLGVIAFLGFWWLFGPVLIDDGWVMATVEGFASSGQFGAYYTSYDTPVPLGSAFYHVLDWFHGLSASVVMLRLPGVVLTIATWLLVTATLRNLHDRVSVWIRALAALSFLTMAGSWLITLRPEPFIAFGAAVALLGTVRYLQEQNPVHLLLAGAGAVFAVTQHPAGITAFAPLVVVTPLLWAQIRSSRSTVIEYVAMTAALGSLGMLLLFTDVHLPAWLRIRSDLAVDGVHGLTWRDELFRYGDLFRAGNGLRRLSWMLPAGAVVLYVTRPDRRRDSSLSCLPARSFVIASLLLALTPSKWLWQFGVLAPLAAVLVATEWRRERDSPRSPVGHVAVLIGLVVMFSVAWAGDLGWNVLSILELDVTTGTLDILPVDLSSPGVWAAIALVVVAVLWRRRSRAGLAAAAPVLLLAGVSLGLMASVVVLAADTAEQSPRWSLARQNIDSVTGSSCGLADEVTLYETADVASETADAEAEAEIADLVSGNPLTFTADSAGDGVPFGRAPARDSRSGDVAATGWNVSEWYRVEPDARGGWHLGILGRLDDDSRIIVQGGRAVGEKVEPVTQRDLGPVQADQWTAVSIDDVLPDDVDRVRVVALDGSTAERGWVGYSVPYREPGLPLDEASRDGVLISPAIRPYFPCLRQPPIRDGAAATPRLIIDSSFGIDPLAEPTSPFHNLGEAAWLTRFTVDWSGEGVLPTVTAYRVDPCTSYPACGR